MAGYVIAADEIRVGDRFSVSFQRTLRVPEDGREYPLPPGLGRLPLRPVSELGDRAPPEWLERGGAYIPLYQCEALWLAFGGAFWKPNAVQVAVGGVNAVSGGPWEDELEAEPQNYVVAPEQPWLDGVNSGTGHIRQFVAVPLGSGRSVAEQVTGEERVGGLQIRVYEPRPGRFPDEPEAIAEERAFAMPAAAPAPELGLGAGGKVTQKIYPDRHGIDTWDEDSGETVFVHIVNSAEYESLTGREPPPTPVSAATYTQYGLPWFELYDEDRGDVSAPESLGSLRPSGSEGDDESVDVDPGQVRGIRPDGER